MIFTTLRGKKARRLWILDADLAGALDAWSHCSFADCWGFEQGVLWG
jgi:hypothetical protein